MADHAHLYGDGLFEGIRFYDRKVFKLHEHLTRLYEGCRFIGFEMRLQADELREIILDMCRQADLRDGYIRLNVTRGNGLGLDPRLVGPEPNVMVMVSSLSLYKPEQYEAGLEVITSSFRTIPSDSLDPRLKCIGRYAVNIMAKMEAIRAGAGEALMLNHEGLVAECTGDNLFAVCNGVVRTPHATCGILKGITRDTVIDMCRRHGTEVEEDFLTRYDVLAADEVFLTGTAAEIIPVVGLDATKIADGKPGPVTKQIMARYREEIRQGDAF